MQILLYYLHIVAREMCRLHRSTADKDWDIQSGCNVAWKNEKATETVEPGDQTETTT